MPQEESKEEACQRSLSAIAYRGFVILIFAICGIPVFGGKESNKNIGAMVSLISEGCMLPGRIRNVGAGRKVSRRSKDTVGINAIAPESY